MKQAEHLMVVHLAARHGGVQRAGAAGGSMELKNALDSLVKHATGQTAVARLAAERAGEKFKALKDKTDEAGVKLDVGTSNEQSTTVSILLFYPHSPFPLIRARRNCSSRA